MLLLCLPTIVGGALLLVCGLVFGLGALLSGGLSAANGSNLGVGAIGGGVMLLCLIGLVVVLAIYALQFFAIPRVMLDGVEPFAAMKESSRRASPTSARSSCSGSSSASRSSCWRSC